jgi:hypothetical protein
MSSLDLLIDGPMDRAMAKIHARPAPPTLTATARVEPK